jgi:hypothetical protein
LAGSTTAQVEAQISFTFTYTGDGAGFNDPTNGAARQAALQSAAAELARLLPVATPVTVTFLVNSNSKDDSSLASAGSGAAGSEPGFSPTIVQQKIITGIDANGDEPDGEITWNFSHNWALGESVAGNAYDFRSTAMHEILHAMGFVNAISQSGQGLLDLPVSQPNLWYTFDQFIVDASGNRLVRPDFTFNSSLISSLTGGASLFFNGPNAVAANGGRPVVLYSPNTWEEGSSGGSHTDDATYTGSLALLMNAATDTGLGSRTLSALELGILRDLGYQFTNSAPAVFSYLSNLSVRSRAGTGAQTLIVGFVTRNGNKPLLIRGIGPTLGGFGVGNPLADPVLSVTSAGGAQVASNDDWLPSLSGVFAQVGAFALQVGSLDAAISTTVTADLYSAQVAGVGGATGVALVELYDVVAPVSASGPRLVNVSARTQVGTGADILIAGFAIGGTGPRTLLIRAVGPTLSGFGVEGALVDPRMELYRDSTKLDENDDWVPATVTPVATSVGAFPLPVGSRDAALVVTLQPGSYTVQVSGANSGTGVALIEIYDVL